jgi:hypothetical protein
MQSSPRYTPRGDFRKVSLSLSVSGERPAGVSLVALYYLVSSLYALLLLILAATITAPSRTLESSGGLPALNYFTIVIQEQQDRLDAFAVVGLLVIALGLAVGAGLWRVEMWACYLAIFNSCISLVLNLCDGLANYGPVSEIVIAAIQAAILLYLLRPRTRHAFVVGAI